MICQRCGKCCCDFLIIVIHPDFVKEDLDINKLPEKAFLCLDSESCPHLSWDGDIAVCAIHHYKWYKETPCYSYGQIEMSEDKPCRTGVWMRENQVNVKDIYFRKWQKYEKLVVKINKTKERS